MLSPTGMFSVAVRPAVSQSWNVGRLLRVSSKAWGSAPFTTANDRSSSGFDERLPLVKSL